jgi:ribosomal protein S1
MTSSNQNKNKQAALQPTSQAPKQFIIPLDSEVTIKPRRKEDFGYFQAISPLSDGQINERDIFDKLANIPASALKVFIILKNSRNDKSALCTHLHDPRSSKSEREVFNRGIRDLMQEEIIKRVPVKNDHIKVRKGTYMMNPILIKCKNYQDACLLWSQL